MHNAMYDHSLYIKMQRHAIQYPENGNLSFHAQSITAQSDCKETLVTPLYRYLLCGMALFMIWYVLETDFNPLMSGGNKGVTHT